MPAAAAAALAPAPGFTPSRAFLPGETGDLVEEPLPLKLAAPVLINTRLPLMTTPKGLILIEPPVLLSVDGDQFVGVQILEHDLVVVGRAGALAAARFDPALGLVGRQIVRRHHIRVVYAARHQRPVRVALQKTDDHFLADAWDVNTAPLLARPRRGDAQPARGIGIVLSLAVPMELDLHTAVLVGENLFSRGA